MVAGHESGGCQELASGPPTIHEGGRRALPPWVCPLSRGPPGRPLVPIFGYMRSFALEKIISKLSGRNSAATRRNLGGTNLGLRWSCSARETSLREGEIICEGQKIMIPATSLNTHRTAYIGMYYFQ